MNLIAYDIPIEKYFDNEVDSEIRTNEYLFEEASNYDGGVNELIEKIPVKEVSIYKIIPTQIGLHSYKFNAIQGYINELPLICERDGLFYIEDGHHRIAKAISEGNSTIKAKVYPYRRKIFNDGGVIIEEIKNKIIDILKTSKKYSRYNIDEAQNKEYNLIKLAINQNNYFGKSIRKANDNYLIIPYSINLDGGYDTIKIVDYIYFPKPNNYTKIKIVSPEPSEDSTDDEKEELKKYIKPILYDYSLVNENNELIDDRYINIFDYEELDSSVVDEEHLYRGMSSLELDNIISNKYIKSDASMNLQGQEESTSFAQYPSQASSYAFGFTAWYDDVTFENNKYVIKIKREGLSYEPALKNEPKNEVNVYGEIPLSNLVDIYEIRLGVADSGSITLKEEFNGNIQEGSRSPIHKKAFVRKLSLKELEVIVGKKYNDGGEVNKQKIIFPNTNSAYDKQAQKFIIDFLKRKVMNKLIKYVDKKGNYEAYIVYDKQYPSESKIYFTDSIEKAYSSSLNLDLQDLNIIKIKKDSNTIVYDYYNGDIFGEYNGDKYDESGYLKKEVKENSISLIKKHFERVWYKHGGVIVGEEMANNELPTLDEAYDIIENEESRQGGVWIADEDDDSENARFENKEQAMLYVKEIYDFLEDISNDNYIPIYRCVDADEVDLDPYSIGESWSIYLQNAKEFGSHLGVPLSKLKIISGYVPKENVDWESALRLYHIFSSLGDSDSEFELPIPSNNKILNVTVSNFKDAKELNGFKN